MKPNDLILIGVGKAEASPPSEPCKRFSRTRLSGQLFPHRDWLAITCSNDPVSQIGLTLDNFIALQYSATAPALLYLLHPCSRTKALTPAGVLSLRQVSPLISRKLPTIPSPTT